MLVVVAGWPRERGAGEATGVRTRVFGDGLVSRPASERPGPSLSKYDSWGLCGGDGADIDPASGEGGMPSFIAFWSGEGSIGVFSSFGASFAGANSTLTSTSKMEMALAGRTSTMSN
jgi:hypothetical protein